MRRTVLAHRAWAGTERGVPDASAVAALAREALEGDELLHDAGRRAAYHLATRALVLADHADEAHAAITRLRDHAVARGSLRLHAAAAWYAADAPSVTTWISSAAAGRPDSAMAMAAGYRSRRRVS